MKGRNKRDGALTAMLSIVALIMTALVLIAFYSITKYVSFLLVSLLIIPPTLLNFIFVVISREVHDFNSINEQAIEKDSPVVCDNKKQEFSTKAKNFFESFRKKVLSICNIIILSYRRSKIFFASILFVLIELAVQIVFWMCVFRMTSLYTMNYLFVVILLVLFVLLIVAEKYCKHVSTKVSAIAAVVRNLRSTIVIVRFSLILLISGSVIKLLGLYDLQKWLVYILIAVFGYSSVFIIISFVSAIIKKELLCNPLIIIPVPFASGNSKDLGVLSYLEENTGITMRTLWSIQLVKNILPYTVMASALIFWLCTGIVQVESYQSAAVYRLGILQKEALDPGIHLTLPWPIDKVEIIDTEKVNKITIGYNSVENTDNIWTGTHGVNEYRLLLGSGNELVSINLRVEYDINDVIKYLKCSASPEKILEMKAYEIVTDRTINSNLETMLSVDRHAFAEMFCEELINRIDEYNTGIEVVGVVLESIHPPVDVAPIYQDIISAEITAEKYIFDAEAEAATKIAGAEEQKNSAIAQAKADNYTRVATAKADVAEFVASLNADNTYGDTYRYYKYMNAIRKAYGSSKLVIVGEGVDSSNIYFGNFVSTALN